MSSITRTRIKYNIGSQSDAVVVELTSLNPVPSKLVCTLCQNLLRNPNQVTCCGSLYCRACLDRLGVTLGKCVNDKCGKSYTVVTRGKIVASAQKKILQWRFYCPKKEDGCGWSGTVAQLQEEHWDGTILGGEGDMLKVCQFYDVKCPNQCGLSVRFGLLNVHLKSDCLKRSVACEYCGEVNTGSFIYTVHPNSCPNAPVKCPNRCGQTGLLRNSIMKHVKDECPLRVTPCDYSQFGCTAEVRMCDMPKHNAESCQTHLDLVSEKLRMVTAENEILRQKVGRHLASMLGMARSLDGDDYDKYVEMIKPSNEQEGSFPSPLSGDSTGQESSAGFSQGTDRTGNVSIADTTEIVDKAFSNSTDGRLDGEGVEQYDTLNNVPEELYEDINVMISPGKKSLGGNPKSTAPIPSHFTTSGNSNRVNSPATKNNNLINSPKSDGGSSSKVEKRKNLFSRSYDRMMRGRTVSDFGALSDLHGKPSKQTTTLDGSSVPPTLPLYDLPGKSDFSKMYSVPTSVGVVRGGEAQRGSSEENLVSSLSKLPETNPSHSGTNFPNSEDDLSRSGTNLSGTIMYDTIPEPSRSRGSLSVTDLGTFSQHSPKIVATPTTRRNSGPSQSGAFKPLPPLPRPWEFVQTESGDKSSLEHDTPPPVGPKPHPPGSHPLTLGRSAPLIGLKPLSQQSLGPHPPNALCTPLSSDTDYDTPNLQNMRRPHPQDKGNNVPDPLISPRPLPHVPHPLDQPGSSSATDLHATSNSKPLPLQTRPLGGSSMDSATEWYSTPNLLGCAKPHPQVTHPHAVEGTGISAPLPLYDEIPSRASPPESVPVRSGSDTDDSLGISVVSDEDDEDEESLVVM